MGYTPPPAHPIHLMCIKTFVLLEFKCVHVMAQRRAQIVGNILEAARTLHGKHDMFQDSETSLKGRHTKILIFGFRQMITMRDLNKLREVTEGENARVESIGILPEKNGPTKKYTGVVEMIFSIMHDQSQTKPAFKRGVDSDDDNDDEEDGNRSKRRQPFSGQHEDRDVQDGGPSLFSRLVPR